MSLIVDFYLKILNEYISDYLAVANWSLLGIVSNMKVLVTGGAGYIGSVTVKHLQKKGFDVVVLDNLSHGNRNSVNCPLIIEDLVNKKRLFSALKNYRFDAVIHLAAYVLAGESMVKPYEYFYNNVQGGLNLLELMKEKSIPYIIYSSSSAVYGASEKLPVKESDSKIPKSVYGESKLIFENILNWYAKIYGFKFINLRYFNAAGASLDGKLGDCYKPEVRLIPRAIRCVLEGKKFSIFGKNYKTPDGTCIRDYLHVEDVAIANVLALKRITKGNKNGVYNLGSGRGYSNLEVLKMVEKVSGLKLNTEFAKARAGDPPAICANIKRAKKELSFIPKYSDLKTIVETSYRWQKVYK